MQTVGAPGRFLTSRCSTMRRLGSRRPRICSPIKPLFDGRQPLTSVHSQMGTPGAAWSGSSLGWIWRPSSLSNQLAIAGVSVKTKVSTRRGIRINGRRRLGRDLDARDSQVEVYKRIIGIE